MQKKICYIFAEVIDMAKLGSGMADKLKNMARGLKDDNQSGGIKGVAEKIKRQSDAHKKQSINDDKASGRKG